MIIFFLQKRPQNCEHIYYIYPNSKRVQTYLFVKDDMIYFAFYRSFRGFDMIYWTPMSGSYFLKGSYIKKMLNILEKLSSFWADTAGLGK